MNSLVLARYAEPLDWIKLVPDDFEVIIYNKGEKIDSPDIIDRASRIIDRPNEGRESETYLHHMLTEARDDQSFTVFSQGEPFAHSPDFIRLLETWRKWEPLQAMSWQWLAERNIPPSVLLQDYERKLYSRPRVRPERFSLTTWGPVDFVDRGALAMGTAYRLINENLPEGINIASHFLRQCKLDEIAAEADKHMLGVFSYGAIFAVRNDLVSAVPRESLEIMRNFSVSGIAMYGYILERIWLHLFGGGFVLPKSQPAPL